MVCTHNHDCVNAEGDTIVKIRVLAFYSNNAKQHKRKLVALSLNPLKVNRHRLRATESQQLSLAHL